MSAHRPLTEAELLYYLENDDTDLDNLVTDEIASDIEDEDIVEEQEYENDLVEFIENTDNNIDVEPEDNHDMVEFIENTDNNIDVEPEPEDNHDIPRYVAKDGTEWFKFPGNTRRKRPTANILSHDLGLTEFSSDISTIRDAFMLFMSPDILNTIVNETNRKGQAIFDKWNDEHPDKNKKFVPVDSTEIEAYIGLLITFGALRCSKESVESLWCEDASYCRPIIPAAMSRDRFKQITAFLRFDNFETREQRKAEDKLAPLRDVFEMFVSNCKRSLHPSNHLCVDEQLVPFRGKAPFRVYMKTKPDKYGIKIWALVDCNISYIVNMQVYLGKVQSKPEKGQGQRVVLDMVSHLGSGYGITTDNFFTSLELADKLWEKKLTLCGTLRKNKTFIPKELLPAPYKKQYSSMFAFRNNRTLVSYVPQKNRGVILLSSEHTDDKVSGEETCYKPDIILHYNQTKGAVDTTDKLTSEYTVKKRSHRWPMVLFSHLLNVAGINGLKLWQINYPEWNENKLQKRKIFLLQLGKELIKQNVVRRYNNKQIQLSKKRYMTSAFPDLLEAKANVNQRQYFTRGRCYICQRSADRKCRKICDKCSEYVCPQHSSTRLICDNCKNNI